MHCNSCGFVNGEDDHRCLRCGRRLNGVVIAAPPDYKPEESPSAGFIGGYAGANALAFAPSFESIGREAEMASSDETGQTAMFGAPQDKPASNLIVFDRRPRGTVAQTPPALPPNPPPTRRTQVRRTTMAPVAQAKLEFSPSPPVVARKLRDDVDAQVSSERPVATAIHRCMATAIDSAIILAGSSILVLIFHLLGGSFGQGRSLFFGLGAVGTIVCFSYGLMWVMVGSETIGMHWLGLELITFDGLKVEGHVRALRFATAWLSFCSGTLGLVWALADEEKLTWHDHISKTFPAKREEAGSFVRSRR